MRKVWLDDKRQAPVGWVRTYWPQEVIAELQKGDVEEISLDHDLGDDKRGTGYDVLKWIENEVATKATYIPPIIRLHTDNGGAMPKMRQAITAIYRLVDDR